MNGKIWKVCCICQALNYAEDETCRVCHSPLDRSSRNPEPLVEWAVEG